MRMYAYSHYYFFTKRRTIMKKRILSALLAAAMILGGALALTACGGSGDTLVMATNASFPPYEYKDGENFAGIDIEIAGKIAEKLGKKLEIKDVEFGSIIGGVQTGKFDIGMAGMTVTEERLQSVNFSTSYATGIQSVIVADKSSYKSIDDFFNVDKDGNWVSVKEGVKIGVQQDTTGDIYASDTVENWGFGEDNVIRYKTGNEAVLALSSGKITAVIIDNEPAKSYVASTAGLRILDGAYTEEQYAICIAKENTALLDEVNKALEELTADGTVQAIIEKYIPSK